MQAGHPCPKATGESARDHLVTLLGGPKGKASTGHILVKAKAMRCRSDGSGKGSRTAAWCSTDRVGDLSCAMVKSGYALRWADYDRERKLCR